VSRTRGNEMRQVESTDDGRTWTPMQVLGTVNYIPGDLCLLPDGRVLLTLGSRTVPFGAVGMVGDTHGHFDWEKRFALVTDAVNTDCGYPSSVVLPDGRALTIYYATGAKDQPTWHIHAGALVYQLPAP
jgi:sialidase-1